MIRTEVPPAAMSTTKICGYDIAFPVGKRPFPAQIAVMSRVLQALKSQRNALLESPTGTGKSLAFLSATLAWQKAQKDIIMAEEESAVADNVAERQSAEYQQPSITVGLHNPGKGIPPSSEENVDSSKYKAEDGLQESSFMTEESCKTPKFEKPRNAKVPKIIFCTRTHSQLQQIAAELRNCHMTYTDGLKMCLLGSRNHYCINDKLRGAIESGNIKTSLDEACSDACKKGSCTFMNSKRIHNTAGALKVQEVWDVEDAQHLGRKMRGCPYFAARSILPGSNYILAPYNYIIDAGIRSAVDIDLKNSVVIFDEAHNIEDVAREVASIDFTQSSLVAAVKQLRRLATKNNSVPYQALLELMFSLLNWVTEMVDSDTTLSSYYQEQQQTQQPLHSRAVNEENNDALGSGRRNSTNDQFHSYAYRNDDNVWDGDEALDIFEMRCGITWDSLTVYREHFRTIKEQYENDESILSELELDGTVTAASPTAQSPDQYGSKRQHIALAYEEDEMTQNQDSSQDEDGDTVGRATNKDENALKLSPSTLTLIGRLLRVFSYMLQDNRFNAMDYRVALQRDNQERSGAVNQRKGRRGRNNYDLSINIWCLNAAVAFREISEQCHSVLLTSGTLSPLDSFAGELGTLFPIRVEAGHVINVEKQVFVGALSTCNQVSLTAVFKNQNSPAYLDALGVVLRMTANLSPGGVLMFLPSYGLMDKLRDRWNQTGLSSDIENIVNAPIFFEPRDTKSMNAMLEEFYEAIDGSERGKAALVAVCRGKVSEGINFSDRYARTVMVVGIPFPSVFDKKVMLKKEYQTTKALTQAAEAYRQSIQNEHQKQQEIRENSFCSENQHNSSVSNNNESRMNDSDLSKSPLFADNTGLEIITGDDWYKQQAFRAVNQAIGRCIRHIHDFGAILLLDPRYINIPSQSQLSKWVRTQIVPYQRTEEVVLPLQQFFRSLLPIDSAYRLTAEEYLHLQAEKARQRVVVPLMFQHKKKMKYEQTNELNNDSTTHEGNNEISEMTKLEANATEEEGKNSSMAITTEIESSFEREENYFAITENLDHAKTRPKPKEIENNVSHINQHDSDSVLDTTIASDSSKYKVKKQKKTRQPGDRPRRWYGKTKPSIEQQHDMPMKRSAGSKENHPRNIENSEDQGVLENSSIEPTFQSIRKFFPVSRSSASSHIGDANSTDEVIHKNESKKNSDCVIIDLFSDYAATMPTESAALESKTMSDTSKQGEIFSMTAASNIPLPHSRYCNILPPSSNQHVCNSVMKSSVNIRPIQVQKSLLCSMQAWLAHLKIDQPEQSSSRSIHVTETRNDISKYQENTLIQSVNIPHNMRNEINESKVEMDRNHQGIDSGECIICHCLHPLPPSLQKLKVEFQRTTVQLASYFVNEALLSSCTGDLLNHLSASIMVARQNLCARCMSTQHSIIDNDNTENTSLYQPNTSIDLHPCGNSSSTKSATRDQLNGAPFSKGKRNIQVHDNNINTPAATPEVVYCVRAPRAPEFEQLIDIIKKSTSSISTDFSTTHNCTARNSMEVSQQRTFDSNKHMSSNKSSTLDKISNNVIDTGTSNASVNNYDKSNLAQMISVQEEWSRDDGVVYRLYILDMTQLTPNNHVDNVSRPTAAVSGNTYTGNMYHIKSDFPVNTTIPPESHKVVVAAEVIAISKGQEQWLDLCFVQETLYRWCKLNSLVTVTTDVETDESITFDDVRITPMNININDPDVSYHTGNIILNNGNSSNAYNWQHSSNDMPPCSSSPILRESSKYQSSSRDSLQNLSNHGETVNQSIQMSSASKLCNTPFSTGASVYGAPIPFSVHHRASTPNDSKLDNIHNLHSSTTYASLSSSASLQDCSTLHHQEDMQPSNQQSTIPHNVHWSSQSKNYSQQNGTMLQPSSTTQHDQKISMSPFSANAFEDSKLNYNHEVHPRSFDHVYGLYSEYHDISNSAFTKNDHHHMVSKKSNVFSSSHADIVHDTQENIFLTSNHANTTDVSNRRVSSSLFYSGIDAGEYTEGSDDGSCNSNCTM